MTKVKKIREHTFRTVLPVSNLLANGRQFDWLRGQQALLETFMLQKPEPHSVEGMFSTYEAQSSKNLEEMTCLSWSVVPKTAQNLSELQIKARMLSEWCVSGDGDLVHDLALSLCQDIIALAIVKDLGGSD